MRSNASWDATAAGTLEALAAVHSGSQDAAAKAINTFDVSTFVKLRLLRQARTFYKSETAGSWGAIRKITYIGGLLAESIADPEVEMSNENLAFFKGFEAKWNKVKGDSMALLTFEF